MIPRAVEIAGNGRYLKKERGFLAVYHADERLGRIPLDDIGMVLATGHGLTYSNNLLLELSRRDVPLVICDKGFRPAAIFWPLETHYEQSGRMAAQVSASKPLCKQLWKQIVEAKIRMQAAVVQGKGRGAGHLRQLAGCVQSGDVGNNEATAARLYWRLVFGEDFRRNRQQGGANALLNYGYTVLRATAARAVMLAGLHPSFGLHHHNTRNGFPLVDDLMEPYRPIVDKVVLELLAEGAVEVDKCAKRACAEIPVLDVHSAKGVCTVAASLNDCALSLAEAYEGKRKKLIFPKA